MTDEIVLSVGETEAALVPKKGANVSLFRVKGKDILFPDAMIETPQGQKRRGGIPVLFPNAGPLDEKTKEFKLAPHGFGRNSAWQVGKVTDNQATLELSSNSETLEQFSFEFLAKITVTLKDKSLHYELTITNPSDSKVLSIAPGLHPYFAIDTTKKHLLQTNIPGFDPKTYDWNTPLYLKAQPEVEIIHPENGKIYLKLSSQWKALVVWSEPSGDYICVEPWVGEVNALLNPSERLEVQPGQTETLIFSIEAS